MPLYCIQGSYTRNSMLTIIKNKEDRTAAAATACESVGGKLICMYGASGQDYHIMAIAEMPSLQSYMTLYMKLMQSGAFDSLKTVNLHTVADIAAAATMASDASYTPPKG